MVASSRQHRHAVRSQSARSHSRISRERALELEREMATQTLGSRVDSLEERVTRLEELPARVDALTLEVSQLRDEMRVEFSAVRDEIRIGDEETRRVLRDEIHTGLAEVMTHARVLHEDQKAALALVAEGFRRESKPKRRK
jgi:lipoate-protein ligase A